MSNRYLFMLKVRDYVGRDPRRISLYVDYVADLAKHFSSQGMHANLLYCSFGETTIAFITGRKMRKIRHQVLQRHGCVFHSDMIEELDREFEKDRVRLQADKLWVRVAVLKDDLLLEVYNKVIEVSDMPNRELLNLLIKNIEEALKKVEGENIVVYFDETRGEVNFQAIRELRRPVLMVTIGKIGAEWRWKEDLVYIGLLKCRIYDYLRRRLRGRAITLILKAPSSIAHMLGMHSYGVPVEVYHYDLDAKRYTFTYRDPPGEMVEVQYNTRVMPIAFG